MGCNMAPIIGMTGQVRLEPGMEYYGVSLFPNAAQQEIRDLEEDLRLHNRGQIRIWQGDARHTGLPDDFIHEVVSVDVFCYRFTQGPRELAQEAARVMIPDSGIFRVIETISPSVMPLPRLRAIMASAGLAQVNEGNEHNEDIDRYTLQSNIFTPMPGERPYMAIFAHATGSAALRLAQSE